VLKLHRSAALERSDVAIGGEADRIPETHGGLNAQLVLEGTTGAQPHLRTCVANGAVLEDHRHNRGHRKAGICQLCVELGGQCLRVLGSEHLEAVVAWGARLVILEAASDLNIAEVCDDLRPAERWHFGDGADSVWDVRELEIIAWGQLARQFASDFWCHETHASHHRDAAVLKLHRSAALERSDVAIGGEADWIPEAHRGLNSQFVLESPQWRIGVQRPVTPSGARQTILVKHAHDGHHRKTAVGEFGVELALLLLWIRRGDSPPAQISWRRWICQTSIAVVGRELISASQDDDLRPALDWHLGKRRKAVWHIRKFQARGWRQVTRKLEVLWDNISDCGVH